jgi:hypothetical protein
LKAAQRKGRTPRPSTFTPSENALLDEARDAVLADVADRSCDVFLSHASADSETAAALHGALNDCGLEVWVDFAKLRLGYSLARQIDQGIARCSVGLILVTPTFLTGRHWTEKELGALLTSRKRVIPILHDVSFEDLGNFSPFLADLAGLSTAHHSVEEIAEQIAGIFDEDD